jgi:hypothetical protein
VVIGGHFDWFGEGIGFERFLVKGFGDVGAVLEHGTDGYLACGAGIAWGSVGFDIVNASRKSR